MKNRLLIALLALVMCFMATSCSVEGGTVGGSESNSVSSSETETGSSGQSSKPSNHPAVNEVDYSTYGSFWMRGHNCEIMPVAVFNALPTQRSDYSYNYLSNAETVVADYAAAGVNTLYALYELCTMKEVEAAMDACYDNGLVYMANMGGADNLDSSSAGLKNLARIKYHDAFAGVMACDEPGANAFQGIANSFAVLDEYIDGVADGLLWHVNLFPNYATQKQLYYRVNSGELPEGGYSYEQYVTDYMRIVQPKVLSYDYYPCKGAEGELSSTYFENMSIIRKHAKEANVPFWVYIQACSYNRNTRVPTEGDILWQVNTALCYGAKGIQYFCGVTPSDGGGENFVGSYFDRDGNKTDIYNYAKRANLQIAAIDEVLMRSKSQGVIIGGATPWEVENTKIPQSDVLEKYGVLTGVDAWHALVGCFDYDGQNAYYAVNNSTVENDTIKLSFGKNVKGYYVQNTVKKAFDGSELTVEATAGEGVLVVIE